MPEKLENVENPCWNGVQKLIKHIPSGSAFCALYRLRHTWLNGDCEPFKLNYLEQCVLTVLGLHECSEIVHR